MMGLVRNFPETDNETVARMLDPLWIKRVEKSAPKPSQEKEKAKEPVAVEETGRKGFLDWIFN